MTPAERHMYAVKEMERVVHEFELFAESSCSAQELTGVIVQHVLKTTDVKRKVSPLFTALCILYAVLTRKHTAIENQSRITHTHTPVSQYQKGKTNLDFTEARDSEWQWHQLEHMQVCT